MARREWPEAYDGYLRRLGEETSDLPAARREEIIGELRSHLEDADAELAAAVPEPATRAARVLARLGGAEELGVQFGLAHAGLTGYLRRALAPASLVVLAAGHLAAALAIAGLVASGRPYPPGYWSAGIYLLVASLGLNESVRHAARVARHPFRAATDQWLPAWLPLALSLGLWGAGTAAEGASPAFYHVASEDLFGVLHAALALWGALVAAILRQPRWLLPWAGVHGLLLLANPLFVLLLLDLGQLEALATRPSLAPFLLLPWLYGGAATLLGLPLRRLPPWLPITCIAGGVVSQSGVIGQQPGGMSTALLPSLLWLWATVLPLPLYAGVLWRSCDRVRTAPASNPLATLLLTPLPLAIALALTHWTLTTTSVGSLALWGSGHVLLGVAAALLAALLAAALADLTGAVRRRARRAWRDGMT